MAEVEEGLLAKVSQAVLDSLFQITVIDSEAELLVVIISVLFTSVDADHNMTVILFGDGMILGFQILLAGTLEERSNIRNAVCMDVCEKERIAKSKDSVPLFQLNS